ncbi:MAG: 2'-5' RNA ligase family protein [Nocardioidaceae bacterium]
MAVSVCLLLDEPADTAVRRLWRRLEDGGISTLLTHTHGHHVPHLSFASLRSCDLDEVRTLLADLPPAAETTVHFDGLGMFRRSRCWLLPAVSQDLVVRQEAVMAALMTTDADLHRHYLPGTWMPHLTLAPRVSLSDLAPIARAVFEILPLPATMSRAVLVDTSNGRIHHLPHLI